MFHVAIVPRSLTSDPRDPVVPARTAEELPMPHPLGHAASNWRRRSTLLLVIALLVTSLSAAVTAPAEARTERFLIADRAEIMALPTSGPAWNAVVAAADRTLTPDLSDQDNRGPADAVAAGLVYVRTGDARYRTKVVTALQALPGQERRSGTRVLSIGRQLAGWVLAADLVDHRDPTFVRWVDGLRTSNIGGHNRWYGLSQTHEDTANNWGTFAGVSRLAASLYVGDASDVRRVASLFQAWLGENPSFWPGLSGSGSGQGFKPTSSFDGSWNCRSSGWIPLNTGCTSTKAALDGAIVEDISRSATSWPQAPDKTGFGYSWEVMQAVTLEALLLSRNGYPDAWEWSDQGLRRATDYLRRAGGFNSGHFSSTAHWVPWMIDAAYGTNHAAGRAAGKGRSFGFTDWLAPALSVPRDRNAPFRFRDVSAGSTHDASIHWLADRGLTRGCTSADRYCPADEVSRAQMASFLRTALELPDGPKDLFLDVSPSSTHAAAIGALRVSRITVGCDADGRRYCPSSGISRAQMASFLTRALDLPVPARPVRFSDLPSGAPHADAVAALHEAGITSGCSADGRFCPNAPVTRAQMATFLRKALER
jgi:hypothetical protein